jgi:hypothetical protein
LPPTVLIPTAPGGMCGWLNHNGTILGIQEPQFEVPVEYRSPQYMCSIPYVHHEEASIATGNGLDGKGFDSRQGQEIFLYSTSSRLTLGPTKPQLPIQWVPGIKRQGREANHLPPSSAEVKNGAIPPFHHTFSWNGD